MLYGQVAAEDLQKHAAELLRGDVVQQGVHHGAEVEEDVRDGKKSDVRSEVGDSPVLLWFRSSHDPSNLVWHPAYCQSCNNKPCEQKEKHRVTEYPELEGIHEDQQVQRLGPQRTTQKSDHASESVVSAGEVCVCGKTKNRKDLVSVLHLLARK